MIEGYSPWHTDENKRYCLMDTMDIVAGYRKAPDIMNGVRTVLEGRTLVIIPNVVAESAGVCKELSGKEWDDLKTLESDIKEGVRSLGIPVEFAFTPDEVLSEATARIEYLSGDSSVAVLEIAGECWGTVRECSIDKPGAAAAIGAYYRVALLDGYCQCGSRDGRPFRCTCGGNHYGNDLDNGLEKDGAWKFLGSLPEMERRELQSLEWSFRHVNP